VREWAKAARSDRNAVLAGAVSDALASGIDTLPLTPAAPSGRIAMNQLVDLSWPTSASRYSPERLDKRTR